MIGALIAKRKIRSGFSKLSEHRLDEFLKNWADDATYIYPGNLSVSGEYRSKQDIEVFFRKWLEQFPVSSFTLKHICVQNTFDMVGTNHIAVEWDATIKNKNGKEHQNHCVTTIDLKMGKAILVRDLMADMEAVKEGWGE
jgi:ketosteroid isomerase-like protein